jgi:hypothetical protein
MWGLEKFGWSNLNDKYRLTKIHRLKPVLLKARCNFARFRTSKWA